MALLRIYTLYYCSRQEFSFNIITVFGSTASVGVYCLACNSIHACIIDDERVRIKTENNIFTFYRAKIVQFEQNTKHA